MTLAVPTTTSDYQTFHTGSAVSGTVNKPPNTSDNDVLCVAAYFRNTGTSTITPDTGWAAVSGSLQQAQATIQLFTKPIPSAAAETATSYTFSYTGTSARVELTCFRITGANTSSPVDASGTWVTTGTTSIVIPSVTAVSSSALWIGYAMAHTGSTTASTFTAPGTSTLLVQDPFNNGTSSTTTGVFFESLSSSGSTGTRTVTVGTATPSSIAGFGFTVAPGAIGATVTFPQNLLIHP